MRNGLPVIAAHIKTLAAIGDSPDQDRLPGSVVVLRVGLGSFGLPVTLDRNQIERSSREISNPATFLMRYIACHRQRLEIHLRSHDSRSHAKKDTAFEFAHGIADREEVAIAGSAVGTGIEVGMLMQNVIENADVSRDGYAEAHAGCQYAEVLMRIVAFENVAADRLAQAHSAAGAFTHDIIDLARFAPQTEFAAANVARHTFARRADPGQLIVMNR